MQPLHRIKELDSLRGLAALLVVFFHFTMLRPEASIGFKLGTTGVDLFFIISGFVIYMSLSHIKSSKEFIINRFSRLFPTYWVCVTFTFVLITIISYYRNTPSSQVSLSSYLANLTMFQYYFGITDIDGPYWTMIIEMLFYIGILFLFRFNLLKYLNVIGIVLCITSATLSYFNIAVINIFISKNIPILAYIPLFFAGISFYKIHAHTQNRWQHYLLLMLFFTCQVVLFKNVNRSIMFINQTEYAIMLVIYFSLFILFVNNKLKFVINKPLLFFGKISFALYLIHQYISIEILIPYFTIKHQLHFWVAAFITLSVIISIATLITYYIEIPVGKFLKAKLKGK